MGRFLTIIFLITSTAYTSAYFDRELAQQECRQQWQDLAILYESCVADLADQSKRLEAYKGTLDPQRVTLDERQVCEKSYPTRYLEQLHCLENAGACHYRDLHGKDPIEEYCP